MSVLTQECLINRFDSTTGYISIIIAKPSPSLSLSTGARYDIEKKEGVTKCVEGNDEMMMGTLKPQRIEKRREWKMRCQRYVECVKVDVNVRMNSECAYRK